MFLSSLWESTVFEPFVYSKTDKYGTQLYYPTTLGNVMIWLLIAIFIAAALLFARNYAKKSAEGNNKYGVKLSAKQLAFCSVCIALGTVLSLLKFFEFPFGGSVTAFSMLIICLPGYYFGLGAGLMTGLAYGLLQLFLEPYVILPLQLVIDYFLAFTALGLSGLFAKSKHGLIKGYIAGVLGRYVFAVLSGWIFFGEYAWEGWNPLPYSLAYNGAYIFAEALITIIILCIPAVSKAFFTTKRFANEG
jgi:thiamine transporter